MSDQTIITSPAGWAAYTKGLDASRDYAHRHSGEPESYPCIVLSNFWDDPNGPYSYDHEFITLNDAKALVKAARKPGMPDAKTGRRPNPLTP